MVNAFVPLCMLALSASAISAGTTGDALQSDGPERLHLRIDTGRVIARGFLGFGVELDPMALNANNRRRGVTDADWKLITDRLAAMRMATILGARQNSPTPAGSSLLSTPSSLYLSGTGEARLS